MSSSRTHCPDLLGLDSRSVSRTGAIMALIIGVNPRNNSIAANVRNNLNPRESS